MYFEQNGADGHHENREIGKELHCSARLIASISERGDHREGSGLQSVEPVEPPRFYFVHNRRGPLLGWYVQSAARND
jgi:hypothetical protein